MSTSMGWKNMMMAGVKKCGRRGVTIGGTPQLVNKTLKFTANFFNENLKRVSALKTGFKKLSLDQRKQIQTVLSNAGYYKSTIDGLVSNIEGLAGEMVDLQAELAAYRDEDLKE